MHQRAAGGEVPHPLRGLSRAVAAEALAVRLLGRGRVIEGSQARRVRAPTTLEALGLTAGALRVHGSHLAVDVPAVVDALWRQRVKGEVCLLCS